MSENFSAAGSPEGQEPLESTGSADGTPTPEPDETALPEESEQNGQTETPEQPDATEQPAATEQPDETKRPEAEAVPDMSAAAEQSESAGDFDIDLGQDNFASTQDDSDDVAINLDFGSDEPAEETDTGINLDFEPEQEEAEEETEDAADEEAALEEFRAELRSKFGDWYVVHTYSGMENRVKQNLENRVASLNMEDYIFEVVVPTEEVTEIRNGQRKQIKRTTLPGYVLVRMDLTDESWSTVRHTPSVTGFVGHSNNPVPLNLDEVEKMLAPAVIAAAAVTKEAAAKPAKKKKVEVADFSEGDSVMVIDGPFAGVHATITELNVNAQRLKALVEILGRETPVDLTFSQIQKV